MWLYTSVGQPQNKNFSIEKTILGWKSTSSKAAFQSNFKFRVGGKLKIFDLRATNSTDLSVWMACQSYVFHLRAAIKTQRFANIWKEALAVFVPLLLRLCCYCNTSELHGTKAIRIGIDQLSVSLRLSCGSVDFILEFSLSGFYCKNYIIL